VARALDEKVIFCTGGGSGIGRAVVEAFVSQGATVSVLEIDSAKADAFQGLGHEVLVTTGDATAQADTAAAIDATVGRFGRIDCAVTFVGIFDHYRKLVEIPPDSLDPAFEELFGTNVKSALVTARAVLPELRRTHGGLIFTLSSSSFYPGRGGILYVASKFALRGVVTQLAHEVAPEVRVNGVAPGGTIQTDLRGARSLGQAEKRLDDRPERREQLEARTPLHVALTPADHTGAYVFLASDDSRGMTGEIIRSDGGLGVR
jgi:NAD(P)-dependent dehydrogenase (short-subunit alcohol dehydrogenase family)